MNKKSELPFFQETKCEESKERKKNIRNDEHLDSYTYNNRTHVIKKTLMPFQCLCRMDKHHCLNILDKCPNMNIFTTHEKSCTTN
jgi:hypothetical protein